MGLEVRSLETLLPSSLPPPPPESLTMPGSMGWEGEGGKRVSLSVNVIDASSPPPSPLPLVAGVFLTVFHFLAVLTASLVRVVVAAGRSTAPWLVVSRPLDATSPSAITSRSCTSTASTGNRRGGPGSCSAPGECPLWLGVGGGGGGGEGVSVDFVGLLWCESFVCGLCWLVVV